MSGVPSMFASAVSRNRDSTKSPSYLKRNSKSDGSYRLKADNILAAVDGAIKDGATDKAKSKKASRERSKSRTRSKSADRRLRDRHEARKAKDARNESEENESSIRSIRSVIKNSPRKTYSPKVPGWKARNSVSNTSPIAPPLTSTVPDGLYDKLAKAKKDKKKEKKEKKKAKKEMKKEKKRREKEQQLRNMSAQNNGFDDAILRNSQRNNDLISRRESLLTNGAILRDSQRNNDLLLRHSQRPVQYDHSEESLANLRRQVQETKNRLKNFDKDTIQQYQDMKKEYTTAKDDIKFRLMRLINAQGKKNDAAFQEYRRIVDEKQKELDDLRLANRNLRTTLKKVPNQKSELIRSNQQLEEANEEVAGHIKGLEKFYKKLQTDQEKLLKASDKCKNEYLPRYRQQQWESKNHVDSETKMKTLYRDCIVKIANHIENSGQSKLVEKISSMVLEVEGEVNPKFDPKALTGDDLSSSDDDDSSSDDSISISSSESESDSD